MNLTDPTVAAFGDSFALLASTAPSGQVRTFGSVVGIRTAVPLPFPNGVWPSGPVATAADVATALAFVTGGDEPFSVALRPGYDPDVDGVLADYGLKHEADEPLMAMTRRPDTAVPAELTLRMLPAADIDVHVALCAEGFGMPASEYARLMGIATADGVEVWVGDVAGEHVTTGMSARTSEALGVFSIATTGAHRRRGYGSALTAQMVNAGFDAGARFAWLQSSEDGFGAYAALGFDVLEQWSIWSR